MFKIACYGVRSNEVDFFNKLNKFNYDLVLIEELLNHDNIETAKGCDAVLLRGNCIADAQNLEKMNEYGIKYVFTRTVGYNHIDLEKCKEYGMKVARVPEYSPNSVAELSVSLAMALLRNVVYTVDLTSKKDFRVTPQMFSREVRNCTVGIIGMGKIGFTEAKLFSGLGAKVVAYDPYPNEKAKEFVTFVSEDELIEQSDIISLHMPYFKGQNDNYINAEFIAKMKQDSILVNTARGELQDNQAILDGVKSGKLAGFATDVMPNETSIFFKKFDGPLADPVQEELVNLYPKVLITPHVGSNTDEALKNMIETSFENFDAVLNNQECANVLC